MNSLAKKEYQRKLPGVLHGSENKDISLIVEQKNLLYDTHLRLIIMGNAASASIPHGARVMHVEPTGPAASAIVFPDGNSVKKNGITAPFTAPLVEYFDVITEVNGRPLFHEPGNDSVDPTVIFDEEAKKCLNKGMLLTVYNYKTPDLPRTVQICPSYEWGGEGLLGLRVRLENEEDIALSENGILHVVDVAENSIADLVGIVPMDDYIIGSVESSFESLRDFGAWIEEKVEDAKAYIEFGHDDAAGAIGILYVYKASTDTVRQIRLPILSLADSHNNLGLSVAVGGIHRLPESATLGRNDWELRPQEVLSKSPRASNPETSQAELVATQTQTHGANAGPEGSIGTGHIQANVMLMNTSQSNTSATENPHSPPRESPVESGVVV